MLSFILFFYENAAQPEVYDNGIKSVIWAFAQYIGAPGGFAETPPITFEGRLVACIIGILGIALFAVPAGLIGAGFTEAMEDELKKKKLAITSKALFIRSNLKRNSNTHHFLQYLAIKKSIQLQHANSSLLMIFLHLYDMVNAMNAVDHPESKLVIINYKRNTNYGCCIDRGSRITLVSTSGNTEPASSWFAYHIAKLGGFNYVAKETETDLDNPTSYYNIPNNSRCPNLQSFIDDINRLASRPNSWVIPILGATGVKSHPSQFYFCYNSPKGDASYTDPKSLVKDFVTFDHMHTSVTEMLEKDFGYKSKKTNGMQLIVKTLDINSKQTMYLHSE